MCRKNFLSWVIFKKNYIYIYIYVCIPRGFLAINVCSQGKTLCSPCSSVQSFILLLQITVCWDVKLCSSIETYRRFGRVYNPCPEGRGSLFLRNCCTGPLRRLHNATYQRAIIFISPLREPHISSFMQNSNFGIRLTHLLCFLRHLTGVRLKDVSRFMNILRFCKKLLGQRDVMCKLNP